MPIVTIDWYAGRTPEQKQEIAERLTDLLVEVGKTPREHVWIRFVDSEKDDWAMGGRVAGVATQMVSRTPSSRARRLRMPDARIVVAPDGATWTVGRQWLPARVRLRRERDLPDDDGDGWSLADGFSLDDITPATLVAAFASLVLVTFLVTVVWPLVALALELLLVFILFMAAATARLLFRRPWRIEARTAGPPPQELAWEAVGWRRSGRVIAEVADALRAGTRPIEPREATVVAALGREGDGPGDERDDARASPDPRYERLRFGRGG